jgi:hypothetical protein
MRIITITVLGAFCAMSSMPGHAQYYGGLSLNSVRSSLPADAGNLLFGSRFFSVADTVDSGGAELRFGYRFSSSVVPHIALVGRYADARRWESQRTLFGVSDTARRSSSYGLDLVGTLPIFDRLSVTGSAGLARVRADSVFGGAMPIGLANNIDRPYTSAGRVGLGVQYDFNRSLGLRFGMERYRNLNGNAFRGSDVDGDTYTFGIRIRF